MENKIPLPTDNIYKFYALFGLLLFIFSFGSLLYQSETFNNLVFKSIVEIETIKANSSPNPIEKIRKQVLEKKLEIARSNKDFYVLASGGLAAISIFLMFYGFRKWHTEIQPLQDELMQLQLRKSRAEAHKLEQTLQGSVET